MIFLTFTRITERKQLGRLYDAPIDVILDERNIVQPDLVFVTERNRAIIRSEGVFGSPDLVVEILSPSSIVKDRFTPPGTTAAYGSPVRDPS